MERRPTTAETLSDDALAARIVDAALLEADRVGWDHVRLNVVADRLGIDLAQIVVHFVDRDAVANAWFDRARRAMLAPAEPGFDELPARMRIGRALMRWFDALAPHRRVTVQMLAVKLWPFHPHHWVPMIFDLSRTILWLREAARLDAESPRREVEEVALTWLFLAALAIWAIDESPGQARTRRFLDDRLAECEALVIGAAVLSCGRVPPA